MYKIFFLRDGVWEDQGVEISMRDSAEAHCEYLEELARVKPLDSMVLKDWTKHNIRDVTKKDNSLNWGA